MSILITYLFIIFVIAGIVVLVSFLAYNRRLDRIARGEERDTHSRLPEPTATVGATYRVVLMAICVITLVCIGTMYGMLMTMQERLSVIQSAQQKLNSEIWNLQGLVQQENRLVLDTYLEVPTVDYETLTAQVRYRITLREYSENGKVSLQINDKEIPMEMERPGEFVCAFESNLFESNETAKIILRENGKTSVEEVESARNLFEKFLPMPICSCFLTSDLQFGKLKAEGYYSVETEKPEEVVSATVTYMTGGSDIKTLDITKQVQAQEEISLEKDLPLEKDLTFRIEILMQNGLRTVKQFMACYEASSGADGMEFERILDGKGNILWENKYYVDMQ
ncbi:MAG: hypothetical protein ACI4FY_08080 [Acetatifactor sp.]